MSDSDYDSYDSEEEELAAWKEPEAIARALKCSVETPSYQTSDAEFLELMALDIEVQLTDGNTIVLRRIDVSDAQVNTATAFPRDCMNVHLVLLSVFHPNRQQPLSPQFVSALEHQRKFIASLALNGFRDMYGGLVRPKQFADFMTELELYFPLRNKKSVSYRLTDLLAFLCDRLNAKVQIPPLSVSDLQRLVQPDRPFVRMSVLQFLLHVLVPVIRSMFGIAPPLRSFGGDIALREEADQQTEYDLKQLRQAEALVPVFGPENVRVGPARGYQSLDAVLPSGTNFQAPPSPQWQPAQPWYPQVLADLQRTSGVQVFSARPEEPPSDQVKGLDEDEKSYPAFATYAEQHAEPRYFYSPIPNETVRQQAREVRAARAVQQAAEAKKAIQTARAKEQALAAQYEQEAEDARESQRKRARTKLQKHYTARRTPKS